MALRSRGATSGSRSGRRTSSSCRSPSSTTARRSSAPIFGVRVGTAGGKATSSASFLPVDVPLVTEEALRTLVRERAVPQTGSAARRLRARPASGGRGADRPRRPDPPRPQPARRRARRATAREREHDRGARARRRFDAERRGMSRLAMRLGDADPPLARPAPGPRRRPARPRARRAVGRHRGARPAHAPRRPRRPLGLPLLRRRLRAARLRRGRRGHADRGRPREPDLARPALPQGRGEQEPRHEPAPGGPGEVPAAVRDGVGGARPRHGDGPDRRPDRRHARGDLGGELARRGGPGVPDPPHARARVRWAARRSTTRRTTSSRSCSRRSARSRSRTRPAYDTAPPSPVWGRRSDEAARPPTRRTSPTPTAS